MATLLQLYARIVLDTNRDDMGSGGELEQAKIDAVSDAIELHADELFWFNRKSGTATTVSGTATVALPAGMRVVRRITYNGSALTKVQVEDIEGLTDSGQPSKWAEDDGAIRLWPNPDAAYALSVFGIADLGVPASTNEWTTEAYNLILNEAKALLYAGRLRDAEGLAMAEQQAAKFLAHLRSETRRRGETTLASDLPSTGGTYNIRTDR